MNPSSGACDVLAVAALRDHPEHAVELAAGALDTVDHRCHAGRVETNLIGKSSDRP